MASFSNRTEAGRLLAAKVAALRLASPLVLALPRGGVPVAAEVARALGAPLSLLIVRKIGAPGQPELAVAAVADGDPPALAIDEDTLRWSGADMAYVQRESGEQLKEIARRRGLYLKGRRVSVAGRTVVLVDDGIATGTTARAGIDSLRRGGAARLVLAVPVASPHAVAALGREVDDLICLSQPQDFRAVGSYYDDFHQVQDDEVLRALGTVPSLPPD